jgi:hypothetical protein
MFWRYDLNFQNENPAGAIFSFGVIMGFIMGGGSIPGVVFGCHGPFTRIRHPQSHGLFGAIALNCSLSRSGYSGCPRVFSRIWGIAVDVSVSSGVNPIRVNDAGGCGGHRFCVNHSDVFGLRGDRL